MYRYVDISGRSSATESIIRI